ncbi:hypothetical protein [Porphyromonas macacae]|uniref:hypothetical protein n=1 Tax=Porphyromonas macacae TaxID=28115 RepID=UPI0016510AAE|nr:hypothetical protein [Porphyromonas macacae]
MHCFLPLFGGFIRGSDWIGFRVETIYKAPDVLDNLFRTEERKDRNTVRAVDC